MSLVNVSSEELPGGVWFKYLTPPLCMHDMELQCRTIESLCSARRSLFSRTCLGIPPQYMAYRAGASCGDWYTHSI